LPFLTREGEEIKTSLLIERFEEGLSRIYRVHLTLISDAAG